MQLPAILIFSIATVIGLVGILFLFFPQRIRQLEAVMNARWGDHEVATVRIGTDAEQAVEQVMNREVLSQQIVWDGWLQRYPRAVGAVLCLLAVWLVWQV
jgi:hypothetical protein